MKKIPLIQPDFNKQEENELVDVIRSTWIAEGPKTKRFEDMAARFLGVRYAVAVPNGTLAIALACMVLGLGNKDEVIIPALTMAGTANGVILAGGKPVLADISKDNLAIDPNKVREKITKRTRAILVVHINGRAAPMDKLMKLARKEGLMVIEDAAQAFGSKLKRKYLGSLGDLACFSFSVPKIVTTGQGGMVVTNKKSIYKKLVRFKDQGRTVRGADIHDSLGLNLRFTDLQAAIGISQMKKLRRNILKKKRIYKKYREQLARLEGVEFIETDLREITPWFMDILVRKRGKLSRFLLSKGIEVREFYPPMNKHKAYRDYDGFWGKYPNATLVSRRGLWLPSGVSLKDNQIRRISGLIGKFYGG